MDDIDAPMPAAALPVINFEIGGQVKTQITTGDPFNFVGSITSLDLDDVQPPSEMEGISYMTTTGVNRMDSPQMSSIRNRRGLPSTLVARRAIAGHAPMNNNSLGHGLMKSVESVNSHTNLENVAPPSLMDELLDSMISVDSITSEVASDPLKRTLCGGNGHLEVSHYETALSDNEDTMTLCSCRELPLDGGATSSNCSSNQSTPVKKRQGSITPKMKREMAKDRFKTYTVKVPGTAEQIQVVPSTVSEVVEEGQTPTPEKGTRMSAKQRRQENRSRFQTQILDYSDMKIFEIAPKMDEEQEGAENTVEMETEEREEEEKKKTTTTAIKKTLMKLIKPGFVAEDTNKTTSTVRGRRKPDYVSPYRRPTTGSATGSANQSPTHKPKVTSVNSPKVGTAAAPGVTKEPQKKSGLISKLKQVTKKSPTKEAKQGASKELNRQGTFTKDEPSNDNIPTVNSLPATPTKRLVSSSSSKLPLVGNGLRKSGTSVVATTTARNGLMKRQISAPAAGNLLGEKRKSMIAAPTGVKSSSGQLSERSTSTASIKSSVSSVVVTKTPNRPPERKLPLSMPTSRSNSTVGTPRTPTTTFASKISLYGRAKVRM